MTVAAAPGVPLSGAQTVQYQLPSTFSAHDSRINVVPKGEQELELIQHRSQLITTTERVRRIHIADPSVVEIIQFSETEFSLIGLNLGTTDLTFWFEDSETPLLYLATVIPDPSLEEQRRLDYGKIERKLALLYPNSKVYLIPMSQKIIVRGQAKDPEEAARIMQVVRGEVLTQEGDIYGGGYGGVRGTPAVENTGGRGAGGIGGFGGGYGGITGGDLLSSLIVNELQVPGEFQVMLRVRIAELSRSQLRRYGLDWNVIFADARHVVGQTLGAAPILTGLFENGEISVVLDALASNGYAKILEDSVVVTMSGNPASFLSGGEFAVPNTVGTGGVLVGTTTFRGFGTSIIATPTVIDDDLIRLQIIPELSAINGGNAVGGVPGVDVRRVQTVVELREGQTIVLGGLFSRQQQAEVSRIPLLGEIPVVGSFLFNTKRATEDETEMLIVVTPEIVRPMDAEEVPPLPGFYVTHPDDFDFYKLNRTEGNPDLSHYRLLPYGNGNGYGENVGFGFHNPDYNQGGAVMQDYGQPMMDGGQINSYPAPQMQPNPQMQPAPVMGANGQPRGSIQQTSGRQPTGKKGLFSR
ncbi:MAG: pilus assembly protein N-terminal domain-containing protein [Planctomycetaceae bacterium]|nr:pilus assembly protein N-terminal domain-containing protein [Planctomycetaceae bacterium]